MSEKVEKFKALDSLLNNIIRLIEIHKLQSRTVNRFKAEIKNSLKGMVNALKWENDLELGYHLGMIKVYMMITQSEYQKKREGIQSEVLIEISDMIYYFKEKNWSEVDHFGKKLQKKYGYEIK